MGALSGPVPLFTPIFWSLSPLLPLSLPPFFVSFSLALMALFWPFSVLFLASLGPLFPLVCSYFSPRLEHFLHTFAPTFPPLQTPYCLTFFSPLSTFIVSPSFPPFGPSFLLISPFCPALAPLFPPFSPSFTPLFTPQSTEQPLKPLQTLPPENPPRPSCTSRSTPPKTPNWWKLPGSFWKRAWRSF